MKHLLLTTVLASSAFAAGPAPTLPGYRPSGMAMWDTWAIEHKGIAHLFHLQNRAKDSPRPAADADALGHAISSDLIHWDEQPLGLAPGRPGGIDDMQPWTGCVVEHAGKFHLFYTMRGKSDGGNAQRIGLATSTDLRSWARYPGPAGSKCAEDGGFAVITPDPRWYVSHEKPDVGGVVDCRDLVILRDPAGQGWLGYYAARIPAGEYGEGGAIAVVRSRDLLTWEHLPPAFAPRKYGCIEVPDVFPLGGKWFLTVLTGNEYSVRGGFSDPHVQRATLYAVADKPEGPFRELPGDNVLLGGDKFSSYSCRSFMFQGERHVLATQGGPDLPATLSPPFLVRTDAAGHLRLAWSPRNAGWRQRALVEPPAAPGLAPIPSHYRWKMPAGRWALEKGVYRGESRSGWQVAGLGLRAAAMEISARVRIVEGTAAGFAFGPLLDTGHGRDLVFLLDAAAGEVRAGRTPDFAEPLARRWPIERGRDYAVRVSVRPPRFEVYLDETLVLQGATAFPAADAAQTGVGLFVDRARAEISALTVWELGTH